MILSQREEEEARHKELELRQQREKHFQKEEEQRQERKKVRPYMGFQGRQREGFSGYTYLIILVRDFPSG